MKSAIEFLKGCYSSENELKERTREIIERLHNDKGYSSKVILSYQLISDIFNLENEIINEKLREADLKERGVLEQWNVLESEPEIIREVWRKIHRRCKKKGALTISLTKDFILEVLKEEDEVSIDKFHSETIKEKIPTSPSGYHHKGNSCFLTHNYQEALKFYETATSLEMRSPSGKEGVYRWSKAEVLFKLNMDEEALEEYRKAIKVTFPDQIDTLFNIHFDIGRIMQRKGNYKEMLKEFSIATSFFKNAFIFGKPRFNDSPVYVEFPEGKGKFWSAVGIFNNVTKILSEIEKIPVFISCNLKMEIDTILNRVKFVLFRLKDWETQALLESE